MPRFFFNVFDGISSIDRDGIVLSDLSAARRRAVSEASRMLEAEAAVSGEAADWRMEVMNEQGRPLFSLRFNQSNVPAALSGERAEPDEAEP